MYNYNYNVCYSHIKGDTGDTTYRKHLLGACNLDEWKDDIIKIQNNIYHKFKDYDNFKKILKNGGFYCCKNTTNLINIRKMIIMKIIMRLSN